MEAQYTVGEYDIVILSATESTGLETWLRQSGYRIPPKAAAALAPDIRQDMEFFVAKVNLKTQKATGYQYLRPIQIAYESKKFMLPIRLGMANAKGPQDLVVYTLTRKGRVESVNYRTVDMPTGEGAQGPGAPIQPMAPMQGVPPRMRRMVARGGANPVVLTRPHVRYDAEHFPEDLVFQETGDRSNYQVRYVLRHPFTGPASCPAGEHYKKSLVERHQRQAETLARLTGWEINTVRQKMGPDAPAPSGVVEPVTAPWYKKLWKK